MIQRGAESVGKWSRFSRSRVVLSRRFWGANVADGIMGNLRKSEELCNEGVCGNLTESRIHSICVISIPVFG